MVGLGRSTGCGTQARSFRLQENKYWVLVGISRLGPRGRHGTSRDEVGWESSVCFLPIDNSKLKDYVSNNHRIF